ncbi:hypothetical protein ACLMJK_009255 [Lecanora helva]
MQFSLVSIGILILPILSKAALLPSPASTKSTLPTGFLSLPSLTKNLTANSRPVPFLIPGTHDTLVFSSFGQVIPSPKLKDALSQIYRDIASSTRRRPDAPVPRNMYKYLSEDGVKVTVEASNIHKMTWSQLDEVITGLGCFMTGVAPGRDLPSHYQELKFSMYISGHNYLGSGMVEYAATNVAAVEKRAMMLIDSDSQSHDGTNESIALMSGIPFAVPNTPMTLVLTQLPTSTLTLNFIVMLTEARSKIASLVARRPNNKAGRNWFEYTSSCDQEDSAASVIVHAYAGQIVTWGDVDNVLAGLIKIAVLSASQNTPGLQFDVMVAGRGKIGLGKTWYTKGSSSISKRAALSASVQSRTSNLVSQSNVSTPSPNSPSSPNPPNQQTNIPFPVIDSPITLTFTEMGGSDIPIDTVSGFFTAVLANINSTVTKTPNASITPHLWYFKFHAIRGGAILSISIYTRSSRSLSWTQLQKLLKGLQVFMIAQRRTLIFDVDIQDKGTVAEGLLWYSPPRLWDTTAVSKRADIVGSGTENHTSMSILSKPPSTNTVGLPSYVYQVPNTPVTLRIKAVGPEVPCIYVTACLTSAIQKISSQVTSSPDDRLPNSEFTFHGHMTPIVFVYVDYNSQPQRLTWQEFGWVLTGLVKFMDQNHKHCSPVSIEVDVIRPSSPEPFRCGSLIMWESGVGPTLADH